MNKYMKKQMTFEAYLELICFEENPQVLDDDMPDTFSDWLGNLDGEDYIRYGEDFGELCFEEGKEFIIKEFNK